MTLKLDELLTVGRDCSQFGQLRGAGACVVHVFAVAASTTTPGNAGTGMRPGLGVMTDDGHPHPSFVSHVAVNRKGNHAPGPVGIDDVTARGRGRVSGLRLRAGADVHVETGARVHGPVEVPCTAAVLILVLLLQILQEQSSATLGHMTYRQWFPGCTEPRQPRGSHGNTGKRHIVGDWYLSFWGRPGDEP